MKITPEEIRTVRETTDLTLVVETLVEIYDRGYQQALEDHKLSIPDHPIRNCGRSFDHMPHLHMHGRVAYRCTGNN